MQRVKNLENKQGALVALVSVPIGNPNDISLRAKETLTKADIVCCEDTRMTALLLQKLGIKARKLLSLYAQNEASKAKSLLTSIKGTSTLVAYCSDAGTPGISDPGALLAKTAIDMGIKVTAIPGPCAAITALTISGLDPAHFVFLGFLSTKKTAREKQLQAYAPLPFTLVFYEAPIRVIETLQSCLKVLGDRQVALLRELTKEHEEVIKGSLSELSSLEAKSIRGECVIVVEGSKGPADKDENKIAELYRLYVDNNISPSLTTKLISQQLGLKKNEVYDFVKKAKNAK